MGTDPFFQRFVERENAEDVMRRVLVHFNTHKNRASLGSPLSCPTSHMLCVPQGVEACGGKHLGVSQLVRHVTHALPMHLSPLPN